MADKEGLVAQFMAITGVDTERATFYLESAGWNLDVRLYLSTFVDVDCIVLSYVINVARSMNNSKLCCSLYLLSKKLINY